MRPSALVERYRMALEVIASGPSFEPGTKVAQIALADPWAVEPKPERIVGKHARELYDELAVEDLRPEIEALEERAEPDELVVEVEDISDDDLPEISLEEIDAEPDAEEAEEEPEVPPQRRSPQKEGRDGLTPSQGRMLEFIRERGEVSAADIRLVLDVPEHIRKPGVRRLIERGLVVAEGERAARVYRPAPAESSHREAMEQGKQRAKTEEAERVAAVVAKAEQDKPSSAPTSKKVGAPGEIATAAAIDAQHEVKRNGVGTDEGRTLEAVGYKPGSIVEIARRLELHVDKVAVAMRKLDREGHVRAEGRGGRVIWEAV